MYADKVILLPCLGLMHLLSKLFDDQTIPLVYDRRANFVAIVFLTTFPLINGRNYQ